MRKWTFFLAVFLLLSGCAPSSSGSQEEFFAMDTLMRITAYDGDPSAAAAAREELLRLERLFSRTQSESDISKINSAAGTSTPVQVSNDTTEILTAAVQYAPEFDITIAPVMDAWGFTGETHHVPSQQELDVLLPLVDAAAIQIDREAGAVSLPQTGMAIDLGGIAKGWAADRLKEVLAGCGVTSALLDLGGNITVFGQKQDGSAWRVAVRDPEDTAAQLCILSLADCTLSTSGGYERYFEEEGKVYHHIIDPSTGYPADSGLLSATVISPLGAEADPLSTRLFLLGAQSALDFWRQIPPEAGLELVLVTQDHPVYFTQGLEGHLDFTGEERGYTYEIVRR